METTCPKCGKKSPFAGNPYRPFCSERCKLLDLGAWLSGTYSVQGSQDQDEDKDAQPEPGGDTEDP